MLIMAAGREGKPMDYDEPQRWTRVGYERDEVTHGQALRRPGVRVCPPDEITSVRQAAAVCNVTPSVVRMWLALGLIAEPAVDAGATAESVVRRALEKANER